MFKRLHFLLLATAAVLSSCGAPDNALNGLEENVTATNAVPVPAVAETDVVGTSGDDAADDPAIWRNPDNPSASLIIGTDKKAGIYVYDLAGKEKSFLAAGSVNNVDIRDIDRPNGSQIIVGASNRSDEKKPSLSLFTLNPDTAALSPLADFPVGSGEAYGFCFGRATADGLNAIIITKEGDIIDIAVDLSGATPTAAVTRTMKLETQSEGCVVDDRSNMLYVGEENVGIWSFDLNSAQPQAISFARMKEGELTPDVEGVALAAVGDDGGYLLASSQGDNSYAVYDLKSRAFKGRFSVADGTIDSTSDTDGIEMALGDFGPDYPGGIFVAQDGTNSAPGQTDVAKQATQNFKYLSWDGIKQALGL